jgi:hypothetical protein
MFTVLVMSPDFALSNYEFDVLWAELGLGRMPHPLQVPPTGSTPAESAVLAQEVRRELTDRGLMAAGHQTDCDLAAMLRLLADHRVAVDLVGDVGYPLRALAATDGRAGVLAVLAGGELWLTRTRWDELAGAIVGLLPEIGPPVAEPSDARVTVLDTLAELGQSGATHELTVNCRAAGCFGFSAADRPSLSWFDVSGNRYLVEHEASRIRISPVDRACLERRVATGLSRTRSRPAGCR